MKGRLVASLVLFVFFWSSNSIADPVNCRTALITLGGHSSGIYDSHTSLIDPDLIGNAEVTVNFVAKSRKERVVVNVTNTTTLTEFANSYNSQATQSLVYALNTGSMELQNWGLVVVPNTKLPGYTMSVTLNYPRPPGLPLKGAFTFMNIIYSCDFPKTE